MTAVSHVVVDGSNIATEGRSIPSLAQLESAVAELEREMPAAEVIVVVDATFAHRIEADERQRFEEAALRGEYVYPPAGAIGRGDAFLLRIAQKIDATVLSNDSFQEFHGEHGWLFDPGRLLGATPVPGVGWIFVPRSPVRGPKSRIAVRDSQRSKSKVEKAIAAATKEAVAPEAKSKKSKKKGDSAASDGRGTKRTPLAVNDPLTFISFVAEHPLGDEIEGEVDSFTSHGAIIRVGEMRCYVPLSGLGDPPPRSAREVLDRGELRIFVLTALDPQRRGVELALPEAAVVSGRPSEETVEAEVAMTKLRAGRRSKPAAEPELVAAGAPKGSRKRTSTAPAATTADVVPIGASRSRRRGVAPAPAPAQAPAVDDLVAPERAPSRAPRTRKRTAPTLAVAATEPAPARAPRSRGRTAAEAPAAAPPTATSAGTRKAAGRPAAPKTAQAKAPAAKRTAARKPAPAQPAVSRTTRSRKA